MHVLGLIPARAGSRGKNLWPLAGKPLLAWTVEAAQASSALTRVVVSTDSEEVAAVARELGAEVLARPAELARNETPTRDVVAHALREADPCDVLVLLQPTSPLRRREHIDEAVRLLLETGADSVLSVVEVPHQFRPVSLMALEDGRLVPLVEDAPTRREDKPIVYARNGPAVLALRPNRVGDDLYGGDCRPYLMDLRDSVDIDERTDLELAELLLSTLSRERAQKAAPDRARKGGVRAGQAPAEPGP
jgi:CMP-N,N'-diacetyllegionaminic acid synthase